MAGLMYMSCSKSYPWIYACETSCTHMLWTLRDAVIEIINLIFLCLTVREICIIYSFSLTLWPCTKTHSLERSFGVPSCFKANMNLPPSTFLCFYLDPLEKENIPFETESTWYWIPSSNLVAVDVGCNLYHFLSNPFAETEKKYSSQMTAWLMLPLFRPK